MVFRTLHLCPAAPLHGFDHAVNRHHVRSVAHVGLFLERHIQNALEGLRHLGVEPLQNLILGPVEVHIVLDQLEVRRGDTTGIAQEVRDIEDLVGLEVFVRFQRAGSVGAFGHDLDPLRHLLDGISRDLIFLRRRDQNVGFLGNPGIAVFDNIALVLRLLLVNRAILIHNGQQEVWINAVFMAVSEGLLLIAIPAGNTCDLATQQVNKANRCILRHIAEALDGGNTVLWNPS